METGAAADTLEGEFPSWSLFHDNQVVLQTLPPPLPRRSKASAQIVLKIQGAEQSGVTAAAVRESPARLMDAAGR